MTATSRPADPVTPVTLVVLDMAGTTVHDDGIVVASFLAADAAACLAKDDRERTAMLDYVAATMGQSKIVVFRRLAGGNEAKAQAANAAFERAYQERVRDGRVSAIPGAEETFRQLRGHGVSIALATGFSRSTQESIISALGWEDAADIVLCPGESIRGRPYPDLPLTALLRTQTASVANMVVIGDSSSDVLSGLAAGASESIGVLTGTHGVAEFEAAGATAILPSVAELPDHLAARLA